MLAKQRQSSWCRVDHAPDRLMHSFCGMVALTTWADHSTIHTSIVVTVVVSGGIYWAFSIFKLKRH